MAPKSVRQRIGRALGLRRSEGGGLFSKRRNVQNAVGTDIPKQKRSKKGETEDPDVKKSRQDEAEAKANKIKKDPKNLAAFAGLGLGAAAVAALTSAALAHFTASDGAEIKFIKIEPKSTTASFIQRILGDIISPTQLRITWEVVKPGSPVGIPSAVRVIKGDEIDISDTGIEKLDGKTFRVDDVESDKVFIISPKISDTSNISVDNKGKGIIHTSFDDQLNEDVSDAVGGLGSLAGDFLSGIMGGIGTIIFFIMVIVLVYFGFQIFMTSSNSENSKSN